jgi:hypothetical protein
MDEKGTAWPFEFAESYCERAGGAGAFFSDSGVEFLDTCSLGEPRGCHKSRTEEEERDSCHGYQMIFFIVFEFLKNL